LPINTTHYAFELEAYLNAVENLAEESALSVNFAPLRTSIKKLQDASAKLDLEKSHAERRLKRILRHWQWWRKHHPGHRHHSKVSRFFHKCKVMLGLKTVEFAKPPVRDESVTVSRHAAQLDEHGLPHLPHKLPWHKLPWHRPRKALARAIKAVRKVNKKLATFEQGFIHDAGIKDREWYRHLGVAPGKWLGYGATTLPALTESITIEKNATLAEYEAKRLEDAIAKLAISLSEH